MASNNRDENRQPNISGVSSVDFDGTIEPAVNPTTHALLTEPTTSDIALGAVELKNATDDTRAKIGTDGVNNSLYTQESKYNIKITESGYYTYIAKAPLGTAQSTAGWQAFRIDETTGMIILWADANSNFDNVATDLTALSYS